MSMSSPSPLLPHTRLAIRRALAHLQLLLQAADPYREHFCTGSAWRQEHPEFEPKLSFYAFDTAVEHVEASVNTIST